MAVLTGAVAYRLDSVQEFEREIQSWEHAEIGVAVRCPEKSCRVTYHFLVSQYASKGDIEGYRARLTKLISGSCPRHADRIRLKPLPPALK